MNAKQPAIEFNNILSKRFCLSCYNWSFHTSVCFIQSWKYSTIKYGNGPVGNGFRIKCSNRVDVTWVLMQFLTCTLVQLVAFLSQTLRALRIIHFLHSYTTRPKKKKKNQSPTVSSKLFFCSIHHHKCLVRVNRENLKKCLPPQERDLQQSTTSI